MVLQHADVDVATGPEYPSKAIKLAVLAPAFRYLIVLIDNARHSMENLGAYLAVSEDALSRCVHEVISRFDTRVIEVSWNAALL